MNYVLKRYKWKHSFGESIIPVPYCENDGLNSEFGDCYIYNPVRIETHVQPTLGLILAMVPNNITAHETAITSYNRKAFDQVYRTDTLEKIYDGKYGGSCPENPSVLALYYNVKTLRNVELLEYNKDSIVVKAERYLRDSLSSFP